jgi:hypothetical protein
VLGVRLRLLACDAQLAGSLPPARENGGRCSASG